MDQAEEIHRLGTDAFPRIVRLNDELRVGKLLGLQGYSFTHDGDRIMDPRQLYNAYASFLASQAFNERSGDILPWLPELLGSCDFYWDYEYRDGQQQGLEATRQLSDAVGVAYDHQHDNPASSSIAKTLGPLHLNNTDDRQSAIRQATQFLEPFAIYGAFWSSVSKTITAVSSAYEIPYIAGVSVSSELVGSPLFARTGLPNDGDARAMMLYYKELQISHVAVLYIKDSWGIHFHKLMEEFSKANGDVQLQGFAYDPDPESIAKAVQGLKNSRYRHVFAILHNANVVLPIAYDHGVVGNPDYVWIAPETKAWTGDNFQISRQDHKLAHALNGIGTLNPYFEPNPAFENAMSQLALDQQLQEDFIAIQASDTSIFDNYTFPAYSATGLAPKIFDAVIALGLAVCNSSLPEQFTPSQFYEALKHVEFDGISERVALDHQTGVRLLADQVRYSVEYITLSEARSDAEYVRFDSGMAAILTGAHNFTSIRPYIYNDNTTNVPPSLPPLDPSEIYLNVLPIGLQGLGYALALLVIVCSMVCLCWTAYNRHRYFVVKASQPFYLCQLCVGTSTMALYIITTSFPLSSSAMPGLADTRNLDRACMASSWSLYVGFSIVFSALASKTWRLNQILRLGSAMRRASVSIWDGMWPLYVHLTITLLILTCATVLAPLQYQRVTVANHVDEFDRSLESYPICQPSSTLFYWFEGALAGINFLGVAILTWITYKGRHTAPDDFSDAYHLAISMMSILEALIVGQYCSWFKTSQQPSTWCQLP